MQQAQDQEVIMIKGKRSKRPRLTSPLITLTMATATTSSTSTNTTSDIDPVNPFLSSSGELTDHHKEVEEEEEEDMVANCLILLAKGREQNFQCKTCNKSFASFQALGGHRASHKRPNIKADEKNDISSTMLSLQVSNTRPILGSSMQNKSSSRVHECSICGAEFGSGQALGGHMRRHRPIVTNTNQESQEVKRSRAILSLDLNLPAAPEDDDHDPREMKFDLFASKEQQVIVFTASPLVDCHY